MRRRARWRSCPSTRTAAAEDWFVDGVTNELTTTVAGWRDVQVIGRGTMATYKGRAVDARAIGRELGVRHVLAGHARRAGDRVSLAVELVDTRDGRIVWADQRELPRGELGVAVGEVAGGIARALMGGYGDAIVVDALKLAPSQAQADDLAMQGHGRAAAQRVARALGSVPACLRDADCRSTPTRRRGLAGVSVTNTNLALWEWADDRAAAIARAEQTLARLDQLAPDLLLAQLAHASLTNLRRDWAGLLAVGDRLVQHLSQRAGLAPSPLLGAAAARPLRRQHRRLRARDPHQPARLARADLAGPDRLQPVPAAVISALPSRRCARR